MKSSVFAASGINRQINFQGKLVNNPAATNVTDTSYTVVFTIYDNSSGGTALWTETQTVTTQDGIFHVALGSVTPIPSSFNFNWSGLYLGMKVNSDTEMSPRIQLAAVPFAFNAQQVAGLTVQDTSGNASTSGTLQVGNAKTVSFADNISFGTGTTGTIALGTGSNTLSIATTTNTSVTLPGSGTLLTNTATANQTVTSTQASGNVLSIADSTGLSSAITGLTVGLTSSTNSQNKTGISFDLSGGTGGTYYDLLGTGSTWSITRAGVLSVASCSGCGTGGGGGNSPFAEITGVNGGVVVANNSTEDLLIGGQSTASATFHVFGSALGGTNPVASISAKTSFAGLVIDQAGVGDVFTASTSGATRFTIAQNGLVYLGQTGFANGGLYFNSVGAGVLGASITTDSSGNLILSANQTSSTVQIGSGNGNITLSLSHAADVLTADKTVTLSGAYTGLDYTFSRALTGGVNSQGGAVLYITDTSGGSGTINPDLILGNVALTSGNFTGSLLKLQIAGINKFVVNGTGITPSASVSAQSSFASLVVDQTGVGDIFTASSSGLSLFTIQKNGYISLGGYNPAIISAGSNNLALNPGSGTLTSNATSVNFSSAALTVTSCSGCGGSVSAWNLVNGNGVSNGGYLTPINSTADFLIGGQSTSSAAFAVTGLSTSNASVTIHGAATIGNNTTGDDTIKSTTSDFTQTPFSPGTKCSGGSSPNYNNYCVSTNNGADTVSTSNNNLTLLTDMIGAGGTLTAPASGPSTGANVGVSMPSATAATTSAFQRPDETFLLITGGANTTKIYDPVQNVFTAGPNLSAAAGNGLLTYQRADGSVLIIHGAVTTTTIYYPWNTNGGGGQTKAGPAFAAGYSPGPGSQIIRLSDGRALIIIGGGNKGTEIYDPVAGTTDIGSFTIGPQLTSTVGPGSFVFQRPDGRWVIGLGCQNVACSSSSTTNVFDPGTLQFSAGPALTAGSGLGAHAIQRPDGKYIVILGRGTTTTNTYDPATNAFTNSGAATTANVGQGAHSFQRSDGKWITVLGGASAVVNLYDPSADTFSNPSSNLTGNAGPGALAFQRSDGNYIVVGGNGTQTTTLFDAGWNTTGTWTSEDISAPKLSTYSAMLWRINPQSANNTQRLDASQIEISVKTANTQANLANNPYISLTDNGQLIQAVGNAAWAKIQVTFNAPVRSYPQAVDAYVSQTNIWGGEGSTFLKRSFLQPTVYLLKIQNPLVQYGGIPQAGGISADPAFGRNFATSGAVLEGVVTDNNNQLSLATNRNFPAATPSAGFIMASASANLGGSAGAGSHTIELPNGNFMVVLGGSTSTRIYNEDTNTFSAGPTLPNTCGTGCHSFQLPSGKFMTILGNNSKNTGIYDPVSNSYIAGPNTMRNVTTGATVFQRPDGLYVIINGTLLTTDIYDPFLNQVTQGPSLPGAAGAGTLVVRRPDGRITVMLGGAAAAVSGATYDTVSNTFTTGPVITTGTLIAGSVAFQLPTGRWLVKTSAALSQTLDPIINSYNVGPTAPFTEAVGSFVIPRPDGKFLFAQGGTTATSIYDPDVGATNVTGAFATAANSPVLPCTPGAGAHVFQRSDAAYVLICGGSNATVTAVIDAGWNLGGTYTTEQINEPNLSSSTSLYWQNVGQGNIRVKYRSASSQVALGLASWKDMDVSGNLINPSSGDTWFQSRFDFVGYLKDFPGARSKVWLAGDGGSIQVYYRQAQTPIMSYWKLINTQTPNILTLTSEGSNVFRFSADGQAFTSLGGAWNSGGADLAERYTSKQSLEAGEVVVGDRLNPQNVMRSTDPYQTNIMGVVSTQPGFVAGAYTPDSYPIALVGRVPVKISTENGPIRAGDYLTSASIAGYAMKATAAGRVLGTALEDFDPTNPNQSQLCPADGAGSLVTTKCGTIMAFINLTSYNGQNVELAMADAGFTASPDAALSDINSNTGLTSYTQLLSAGDKQTLAYLSYLKTQGSSAVLNSEIFTGKVYAANEIISPSIVADLITAKTIRADRIEGLEILTNQLSSLQSQISTLSGQMSTESAVLGSSTYGGELTLSGINVQGLATISADLNVGGNSFINGMLTVLKSITTPNLLVSDFASFMGDTFFKGNVRFAKSPTFSSDTAGFALIKKGSTSVQIDFDNEYLNTPVVTASIVLNKSDDATAEAQLESSILSGNISYVITQRSTKGFVIKLNKPADSDINFSWVSLAIDNAKTSGIGIPTPTINPNSTQSAAFQSILNSLNQ